MVMDVCMTSMLHGLACDNENFSRCMQLISDAHPYTRTHTHAQSHTGIITYIIVLFVVKLVKKCICRPTIDKYFRIEPIEIK
jgi:hypothetical protein